MKARDKAGNEVTTSTVTATTKEVEELNEQSNTVFLYSPSDWTKSSVNVIIATNITDKTLQYSFDATNWKDYTKPVTMSNNGPIYARALDSTRQHATGYATGNVTKIDRNAPNSFTPMAVSTMDTIYIFGSTTDADATETDGSSGIKAYYFSADGGTTISYYSFTGLSHGTTYNLKMKAVDYAGNEVITETVSIKTLTSIPVFTYTGTYEMVNDDDTAYTEGNENWKIRFLTSGTLTLETDATIDVFLVGGGGGGGASKIGYSNSQQVNVGCGGGGGGGGFTLTEKEVTVTAGTSYQITIGAGGASKSAGETTSAFGFEAEGGQSGNDAVSQYVIGTGGSGGSNGGDGGANLSASGAAVSGGSDGSPGQGTTTREFGDSTATLYAGGGGGGAAYHTSSYGAAGEGGAGGGGKGDGSSGVANTGGGGGGKAGSGGSGIVIIRNAR